MSAEPRHDRYDAVVIGAGIGGITAGALLAKAGVHILVVEAQQEPGGYAHAFRRDAYVFNPAVHVIGDERLFDGMLRHLGVRDLCTFVRTEHFYRVVVGDVSLEVPFGTGPYIDAHVKAFPGAEEEIRRLIDLCIQIHREGHQLPQQLTFTELEAAMQRFPTLFRYRRATIADALDEYTTDERFRSAWPALWPYLGLPPSRLSFQTYAQMLFSHLDHGFYCQGGAHNLVAAIVAGLERHGGELLLGTKVERILLEEGKAAGVVLADGRRVRAPTVISNADAKQTFERLLGPNELPAAYVRNLRRLRHSVSAFCLLAATSLDVGQFGASHQLFAYRYPDHDATWRDLLRGEPAQLFVSVPTIEDRTAAPEGVHLLVVLALMPYDMGKPWPDEKDRYVELVLDDLERLFPGLRDELLFAEGATPLAFERFTGNFEGAIYGWENSPAQTGSKRPAYRTPIDGLYLVGQWTQPGGGFLRSTLSGVYSSQMVSGAARVEDVIPALQEIELPSA